MAARLTVCTYNVRALRDSEAAAARVVRRLAPDVVMLQETPRFLRWRSRLAAFARTADLLYVTGGGTTGGSALLADLRVDVKDVGEIRLSKHPKRHQRGLAVAVAGVGGHRLLLVSTHLSLYADEREAHAHEIVAQLRELEAEHETTHTVVAGDLNETPGGPAQRVFAAAGLRDCFEVAGEKGGAPTFPAREPVRRIDAVLVSGGVDVTWAGVPRDVDAATYAGATDHLPVLARLALG